MKEKRSTSHHVKIIYFSPILNIDKKDFPWNIPSAIIQAIIAKENILSFLPNSSIFICRGDFLCSMSFIS